MHENTAQEPQCEIRKHVLRFHCAVDYYIYLICQYIFNHLSIFLKNYWYTMVTYLLYAAVIQSGIKYESRARGQIFILDKKYSR
jgi:hypothetical protein